MRRLELAKPSVKNTNWFFWKAQCSPNHCQSFGPPFTGAFYGHFYWQDSDLFTGPFTSLEGPLSSVNHNKYLTTAIEKHFLKYIWSLKATFKWYLWWSATQFDCCWHRELSSVWSFPCGVLADGDTCSACHFKHRLSPEVAWMCCFSLTALLFLGILHRSSRASFRRKLRLCVSCLL